jgi:hypothetical protein
MAQQQSDLFGTAPAASPRPPEDLVVLIRARLHATLAMLRAAETMPWGDKLSAVLAENAFRFDKDALPPAEAAALWAEFDRELDRLYAVAEAAEARE